MTFSVAVLCLVAAIVLRALPRIRWPHLQGTDAYYHIAYIRLIRETGHRLPRRNPRIAGPGEHAYPALFHWILSFASPGVIKAVDRFGGLICDSCSAFIVAIALLNAGQSMPFALIAAAIYLLLPGLTLTHIGPRAYTLTPRSWAQMLFTVACYAILQLVPEFSLGWGVVAITAIALMALLSKFGVQAALLVLPVWAVFLGSWAPVVVLTGAAILAGLLFRSMFWRQCKGQYFHLKWYVRYNLDMLAHRDNWRDFPELFRTFNLRGLLEALLWHNPVTSGIIRHIPLFFAAALSLETPLDRDWPLSLLIWAAMVPWLVTSFGWCRILGEAERYLEFVAPMALLLLCLHHPGVPTGLLFAALGIYCLAGQVANLWFLSTAAKSFSDREEADVAAALEGQDDVRLLCLSDPESYYFLAHSDAALVKYNGDLSIEGPMEAYITHFFWRYPWTDPRHLDNIVARDRVTHILFNRTAGARLQAASGYAYDFSVFEPILENDKYQLFRTLNESKSAP